MSNFTPVASTRMKDQPGNEDWLGQFVETALSVKEAAMVNEKGEAITDVNDPNPTSIAGDPSSSTVADAGADEAVADAAPDNVEEPEVLESTFALEVAEELTEMASIIQNKVSKTIQIDADSLAELSQLDPRFQPIHAQLSTLRGVIAGFVNTLTEMSKTIVSPSATTAPPVPSTASSSEGIVTAGLFDKLKGAWKGFMEGKSKGEKNKIANAAYAELQQQLQSVIGSLAGLAPRISMLKQKSNAMRGGDVNIKAAVDGLDAEFGKVQQAANAVADVLKIQNKIPDTAEESPAPAGGETPAGAPTGEKVTPETPAKTPVTTTDPTTGQSMQGQMMAPVGQGGAQPGMAMVQPAGGGVPVQVPAPNISITVSPTMTQTIGSDGKPVEVPEAAPEAEGIEEVPEAAPEVPGEPSPEAETPAAPEPMTFDSIIDGFEEIVYAYAAELNMDDSLILGRIGEVVETMVELKRDIEGKSASEAPTASDGSQLEDGGMKATVTIDMASDDSQMKATVKKNTNDEIVEFAL